MSKLYYIGPPNPISGSPDENRFLRDVYDYVQTLSKCGVRFSLTRDLTAIKFEAQSDSILPCLWSDAYKPS